VGSKNPQAFAIPQSPRTLVSDVSILRSENRRIHESAKFSAKVLCKTANLGGGAISRDPVSDPWQKYCRFDLNYLQSIEV
jgi:hypothetical protein